MSAGDKEEISVMLNRIYTAAGRSGWRGSVDPCVAEFAHHLAFKMRLCNDVFNFVPRPIGTPVKISWIAKQIAKGMNRKLKGGDYRVCAVVAVKSMESFPSPCMIMRG